MANIITYQDLFPSSTIMRQAPGNGTITVPGAGDARLIAPNSLNCQFYIGDGSGKAPILYERLSTMWQSAHPAQPLFIETKLSVFTGTTNLRIAGLTLFTALPGTGVSFYSYQMGWHRNDSKLHVWYDYPTNEVEIVTAVTTADPATTPNLYRIYWNPYSRSLYIPEVNVWLSPDNLCFTYSINSGTTWTSIGTRARDFDLGPAYAGVYCRKWETSAVSAQADFAYFQASQYNAADRLSVPDAWGRNQDRSGFEDAAGILSESSAPARFDSPDGIKDSVTLADVQPRASFEDAYTLPDVAGRDVRFDSLDGLKEDLTLVKDRVSFEESLFVQLDNTDYIKAKYDADGREYLGNYGVRHILYYDATLDPWHTHGAGHYGAGRDGKLYYNGVECGPGAFSTVGLNKTAWAGPGDFVDRYLSTKASELSYPVAGTVRFTPSGTGAQGLAIASTLRWFLVGDFDVQIDFNIVSAGSGPSDGGLELYAWLDGNNGFYARRRWFGGNVYDKDVKNNGSYVHYQSTPTSDTSGKLRITRVGSSVSAYYWSGSAWTQIGTSYAMTYDRPVYIAVGYYANNTPTGVVMEASNFVINSGVTTNLVGWAREAAGTYRGSLAEFPQHALFVSSGNSLDIIDVDTNKLWMSFRGATNNFLGGDANYYVPQVVFKDGTLLLSYRTMDSAVLDGGGYWADFTLDFMRLHRGPSYNDAGLTHNVELTTGVWPRDSANGAIRWRNSARGYLANHFDNWQCQNMRVNWCDLLHDAGFQYRLVASNGGVYLAKWQRWKFEGTGNAYLNTPDYGVGTQTVATRWAVFRPTSKDILAHDRINLWITHYATWNATIGGGGGTWLEDHQYTLAGTVDPDANGALAQDSMALDDAAGLLFYARDQGVYVMDLATGTSTLFYGKSGSGATHEVLGDYASVSSVKLATDGGTPILFVGMARPDRIWAVNRTTHAIYWKGFQDDAHQPLSMAVGA